MEVCVDLAQALCGIERVYPLRQKRQYNMMEQQFTYQLDSCIVWIVLRHSFHRCSIALFCNEHIFFREVFQTRNGNGWIGFREWMNWDWNAIESWATFPFLFGAPQTCWSIHPCFNPLLADITISC